MSWENKPKTAGVFIGFELGVYFFEPWMITLGLTVPFILNIVVGEKNLRYFEQPLFFLKQWDSTKITY